MNYDRHYTLTMKASKQAYKGSFELLKEMFNNFLNEVHGISLMHEFEDKDTLNVHVHSLIKCPLIKDKRAISSMFNGWHIHTEIIKYKDYNNIEDIWLRYILKSNSDAVKYSKLYGNMFEDAIPASMR